MWLITHSDTLIAAEWEKRQTGHLLNAKLHVSASPVYCSDVVSGFLQGIQGYSWFR